MENKIYNVGQRVEKFCAVCDEQLGHIVKSITKLGKISRVSCVRCGTRGTYKPSVQTKAVLDLSSELSEPYSTGNKYRIGQIMSHPTFGLGEVTAVVEPSMIDVLFSDRVRRLIHDR